MATGTAGSIARRTPFQGVHYLRATLTYASPGSGTALTIGKIPGYSLVLRGYAVVTTAFNDSGTDLLDIGTSADADGYATAIDLATIGVIETDEMAVTDLYSTSDITVTVTYTGQNANATAGVAEIVIEYIPGHGQAGD